MRQYELHPPHLINVATLPCENKKRKCNITAGNDQRKLHQMYHSFIKVDQGHHVPEIYLYGCYTAKLAWSKDSWHRRSAKTLDANLFRMQTCFNFDRNIINAGVTVWDHMCVLVVDTLNTCSALTQMFIYMIRQNILWNCQCDLMHVTSIL